LNGLGPALVGNLRTLADFSLVLMRIVHVTNIPAPYRIPLFNAVHGQCAVKGWDFQVIFAAAGYPGRLWTAPLGDIRFPYTFLSKRPATSRLPFLYRGLSGELSKREPDLVSVAGFSVATIRLWLYRRVGGVPYVIHSGTSIRQTESESPIRRMVRRELARRASGAIAYGSDSAEYLVHTGIPPSRLSVAINTADLEFFVANCPRPEWTSADPEPPILTFVGYLNARKNARRVLEVALALKDSGRAFKLDMIGDGPERVSLMEVAQNMGLSDRVSFPGFLEGIDLAHALNRSAVFLFQTDFDIWGLVLNEAMAAGLPVLASTHAGATRDLVEHGVNGYEVDYSQPSQVAQLLDELLDCPEALHGVGLTARRSILERASMEASTKGFMEAYGLVLPDVKQ
jgi:glycosyltransferase involved in cell wall biosynthesis